MLVTSFFQALVTGTAVGAIYALIALGYSIIFSTTRVVNFAQGGLLAIGALLGYSLHVERGWPLPLAVVGVALCMVLVGISFEKLIMIPTRRSGSRFAWMIVTLAVFIALENFLAIPFGRGDYQFPPLVEGRPILVGDVAIQRQQIVVVLAALLLMVAFELFLTRTSQGKAIRATAFSADVAGLMGINVSRVVTLSFVLSAVITGLGGILVAPLTFASATMGTALGIKGFIAIVLGGMGSAKGAVVGGLVLGIAEYVLASIAPTGWQNIAVFAILALILLVRPVGLFGHALDH